MVHIKQTRKGKENAVACGSADITKFRRYGNKGLNLVVNILFSTEYTDLCYGHNAFWRHDTATVIRGTGVQIRLHVVHVHDAVLDGTSNQLGLRRGGAADRNVLRAHAL